MPKNTLILTECEEINSLLCKPIIATQRIKYLCLDVSPNYIVLGSTSGSLYLFTREPCAFQQLIPLSEGPVSRVVISPDEKIVALGTKRGGVCTVSIKPTMKLLAVSREHLRENITSLCWNDKSSEIYIGDGVGKISTMVLSKFTVNAMFQAPSCALMHLGSKIAQMDFSGRLLLVSTLTRCYICDTAQEQFKQIGSKARGGEFGACFSKRDDAEENLRTTKDEGEKDVERDDAEETKIYCARPGFRLWEVTTSGTVVKTHQFKDALAVEPSRVYRGNIEPRTTDERVQDNPASRRTDTNFSHLFALSGRYLLSNGRSSIFVLDPSNAMAFSWYSEYNDIAQIRAINDKIYLMRENGMFHCLKLTTAERLIVEFYDKKHYQQCLRACESLKPELLKLIVVENRALSSLDENDDFPNILAPLISSLRTSVFAKPMKLQSGIVVVNSGSGKRGFDDETSLDDTLKSLDTSEGNIDDFPDDKNDETISENFPTTESDDEIRKNPSVELASDFNVDDKNDTDETTRLLETELKSVYSFIDDIISSSSSGEIENAIINVRKKMSYINDNYGKNDKIDHYEILRSTEKFYYKVLLETTTRESLISMKNDVVVNEITRSFVDTNISFIDECTCGYYFPKEITVEPAHLDIGKCLLEKFFNDGNNERCVKLCNSVTRMWRYYLPMTIVNSTVTDDVLRMCLRTGDDVVLSTLLPIIDVRQWEIAVKSIKEMEIGQCPCCDRKNERLADYNFGINWSNVAREITRREGTLSAMTFLVLIEFIFPDIKIDKSVFQSLIFTKILNNYGLEKAVEFKENDGDECSAMCSQKMGEQLLQSMEKDLERPINRDTFGTGPHHWGLRFRSKSSICPCCTLSLNTPVLLGEHGISLFPCGHVYHVSCLIQKKLSKCSLH